MHDGNNPSFLDEQIYSYSYLSVSREVHIYWAVETLGDLQSTSRGLGPWVKMQN
jgi:hypothetical protein